jgi:hypothetical protein
MQEVFPMIPGSSKPLWINGGIIIFLCALACFLGYIAYSTRHVQFVVSGGNLQIKGDLYGRNIALDKLILDQAREVDLNQERPLQPGIRTNGVGLPGYLSGWFKLRGGEKALLFVTDKKHVIYLPTRAGYSLLLSVAEPPIFLAALKRAVTEVSGQNI